MLAKQHVLNWLAEWRDEQEPSSNKYHVYNKAYKSLLATPIGGSNEKHVRVIIEELRGVKYIGDKIRNRIESRANDENLIVGNTSPAGSSTGRSGQKHPGGALAGASPPKRSRTSTSERSDTVTYSSHTPSALENHRPPLPPHSRLQKANTAPNLDPAADMSWIAELGLTPEELALNMFTTVNTGIIDDPNILTDNPPFSPLAPVQNISLPKPKPVTKSKLKSKPTARLSNYNLLPPAISSADNSLILNVSPIPPTTSPTSSTVPPLNLTSQSTIPVVPPLITLHPSAYTIHLVLDTREVLDQKHRDHIYNNLIQRGIPVIRSSLNLGDVGFVAKRESDGSLFVLDCILERKRLDDLVGSIQDGRFHEQKVCFN
jgi:hypothetical protein